MKKFIVELADMKINTLYLYLEWRFWFEGIPATHNKNYINKKNVKEIEKLCRAYNITVVPAINVMGHTADFLGMEAFQELTEYDYGNETLVNTPASALCPNNPKTRALIERAYFFQKYGEVSRLMSELVHLQGDPNSAVLVHFKNKKNGSYLRKAAYLNVNPIQVYLHFNKCLEKLQGHREMFQEPHDFIAQCYEKLGLEKGSLLRIEKTKENYQMLYECIEHLKESHRPLPSLRNIANWLFESPMTDFWKARNDEWYEEKDKFRGVDIDGKIEWGSARW